MSQNEAKQTNLIIKNQNEALNTKKLKYKLYLSWKTKSKHDKDNRPNPSWETKVRHKKEKRGQVNQIYNENTR